MHPLIYVAGRYRAPTREAVAANIEAARQVGIEAARLGHSGGGFTIVAQEIKSLANQTWRATEEIQSQIGAIRDSSSEAIGAIDGLERTSPILLYCLSGARSAFACQVLAQRGFTQAKNGGAMATLLLNFERA